jgi:hypothetical protein
LLDFYTTSHPYTTFAVGNLAEKIGVSHPNPVLYYIPKHKVLKDFNTSLEMNCIWLKKVLLIAKLMRKAGNPSAIISTQDVLKNLHKDEKYSVDEADISKHDYLICS